MSVQLSRICIESAGGGETRCSVRMNRSRATSQDKRTSRFRVSPWP